MYKEAKVYLVIPAYNEEKLIADTLAGVPEYVDKILVVDDGSTDKTAEVVSSIPDPRIVLLRHGTNRGIGAAIITGYKKALEEKVDMVGVVGGDNQMDLSELPKFLDPIVEGKADYVKGNRFLNPHLEKMPLQRLIGNSILSLLTKISSGYWKIFDSNDGYTVISRKALEMVDWDKAWKWYGYNADFLARLNVYNLRVKDVSRKAIYLPGERQSQINIWRYMYRVAPHLLGLFFWRMKEKYVLRDFHPLVLFYLFGMVFLPIGVIVGLYMLFTKLSGGNVTGTTAVLSALFIITGVQLILFAMWFDMEASDIR